MLKTINVHDYSENLIVKHDRTIHSDHFHKSMKLSHFLQLHINCKGQNRHTFWKSKTNYRNGNWPIIGLQISKTKYVLFTKQLKTLKTPENQFRTRKLFGPLFGPQLKIHHPKTVGISSQKCMFVFWIYFRAQL